MFSKSKKLFFTIVLTAFFSGCAYTTVPKVEYVWKSDPIKKTIRNEYFSAEISTTSCLDRYGCEAFQLNVKNKTEKNLELNWNKTLYIVNGQTSGGFMFEGVVYMDRNNPKPPDIIFPSGVLSKVIWPNNLVSFSSGRYGGWRQGEMPEGENGVYLTISVEGKEVSEKLTMVITKTPK